MDKSENVSIVTEFVEIALTGSVDNIISRDISILNLRRILVSM